MPSPSRILYRYGENITSLENRHKETFPPDHFLLHPYHNAVDGKLHTSWISAEGLARGDYYGLDLLMVDACGIIQVSVGHKFQGDLRLQVTEMADFWTDSACEWTTAVDHRHGVTTYTYEQTSRADLCRFRFIRFMVANPLPSSHFQVHEISVSKCASALLRPTF